MGQANPENVAQLLDDTDSEAPDVGAAQLFSGCNIEASHSRNAAIRLLEFKCGFAC